MISKLEKGSEVIAASGILGKVKEISGAYVSIEIGENNIIKLQKSSIANILPKGTIDAIK
jgi:preprotein translocase subunit YajC